MAYFWPQLSALFDMLLLCFHFFHLFILSNRYVLKYQLCDKVLTVSDIGKTCDEVTVLPLAKFFSSTLTQALYQEESHLQESQDGSFILWGLRDPWGLQYGGEKCVSGFESIIVPLLPLLETVRNSRLRGRTWRV